MSMNKTRTELPLGKAATILLVRLYLADQVRMPTIQQGRRDGLTAAFKEMFER